MTDPILEARLTFLEEHLGRAFRSQEWLKQSQVLQRLGNDAEMVWGSLERTIGREAKKQLEVLKNARSELGKARDGGADETQHLKRAWDLYNQAYEHSQRILGECLELIGGIAIRDKGFDGSICDLADEMIRSCCSDTIGENKIFLTVPARQEALSRTLFRMIRLRFPEWTVWDLPFTAHEFGYVLFDDLSELPDLVDTQAPLWTEAPTPSGDAEKDRQAQERARQRAENYLRKLISEVFATYTMGPAYAYAAFLLRFNPWKAYEQTDESPSDAARALVVLATLERMNEQAGKQRPFRECIEYLQQEWKRELQLAGAPAELPEDGRKKLADLASEVWRILNYELRSTGLYPVQAGNDGWLTALSWSEHLKHPKEGETLAISNTSKLRDALNAAWVCRIEVQDTAAGKPTLDDLTQNVQDLCRQIIDKRREPVAAAARALKV